MDRAIVELVFGDDYYAADGRSITFDLTGQPSITGATVIMVVKKTPVLTFSGSVVTATQCRFEFTSVQIATIGVGYFEYDIQATLTNGHVVTLKSGLLHVAADIR